jgi:transposase
MSTRIIGIDLAVTAQHQAAILDPATNRFVVKQMAFRALPDELDQLLARAHAGAGEQPEIIVVLEATSMAWHPVSCYLAQHGAQVYRVNGRLTQDLRRVRTPHARSDRLDCQVLASLYHACPHQLDPLHMPSGAQLTLQRACRELVRWRKQAASLDNRLTSFDNWAWQGLQPLVPAYALAWVRREWYNPWDVTAVSLEALRAAWQQQPESRRASREEADAWLLPWRQRAEQLVRLFQSPAVPDYPSLAALVRRCLAEKRTAEQQQTTLYATVIAPLYRQLYPNCPLTSIYGIGEQSAAIYMAFIHTIDRFPTVASFRQWTGMVPAANQSGSTQVKGLGITQAGPDLIKATLYLDAAVARLWDPQLAHIYYTQMVHYGKHHNQAICAVASHLANRIYAVLKEQRPYVLRNLNGQPISAANAHRLIQERFCVPAEVRRRTNKRTTPQPQPGA